MPHGNQDPNHEAHEAHVNHLRLVLGSILSPKRASNTHSTSVSGTASPVSHHPHAASSSPELASRSASSYGGPQSSARAPLSRSHTEPMTHHTNASHSLAEAVASPHSTHSHAVPPPVTSTPNTQHHEHENARPGNPRQTRSDFITTLQSKSAWDALIHGSFV